MSRKIGAGVASGVLAGIVLDIAMRLLLVHTPDGGRVSMVAYMTEALRAGGRWEGWAAYLIYGAVIGGIFGWLLHRQTLDEGPATFWGGVYGLGWWILATVILVPGLLGRLPFSAAAREIMRDVALPLLIGHVVYGVVLGAVFGYLTHLMGRQPLDGTAQRPA